MSSVGVTLVTGASGFAGRHLLDRLAGRVPLVAWHRGDSQRPRPAALRGQPIDWQQVDLLDWDAVRLAFDRTRPSRVFHLAGAARVDTAWQSVVPHLETNVRGTHHLLEAIRRSGRPCRTLVVSSGLIYQPSERPVAEDAPLVPSSPYGVSKLAQDELARRACAEDGLDVVIGRPFNHAGPGQDPAFALSNFARQIALIESERAEPEIHVGNLDARRDITDVRDVVAAYEALMNDAVTGRPYNVCSGRAPRIGDLLDTLLRLTRVRVRVVVDAQRLRPNDGAIVQGDPTRIQFEVGWTPRTSTDELLLDTLEWWRAEVSAGR